jgi:hypothetical protein
MAPGPFIKFIFAAALFCWSLATNQVTFQSADVPFKFRDAVAEDIDDITDVVLDAFSPADDYKYIYQFRDQYPGYTWTCLRQIVKDSMVKAPTSYTTWSYTTWTVISVPDPTSSRGSRVVSVAGWVFGARMEAFWPFGAANGLNCSQHLDANATRANQVQERMDSAKQKYLDDVYADKQLYLKVLATHPKWDGHGFAAIHLHWGLAEAHKMGVPTTLIATTAGHPLYLSVGFNETYNITIERLDGLGTLWYEVMAYSK